MLVLENVWHRLCADAIWFDILLSYIMKFVHFTKGLSVQIQATVYSYELMKQTNTGKPLNIHLTVSSKIFI